MNKANEELLAVFDSRGNVIEPLPRSIVHRKPVQYWHGVVNVWLVNNAGELMVSKRGDHVGGNPGKWQTYFGGHLPAGLSHIETAVKELQEEIGLDIKSEDLHLIDKGQFANEDHFHFYESYAYLFNGQPKDLNFVDGEVSQAQWMSMEEYENARMVNPEQWCNECSPESQQQIMEWLKNF